MNRQPAIAVIAMIAVASASACGERQGQPEPREPRVKLLTSEAAKGATPIPSSWCIGMESELADDITWSAPGDVTSGRCMTGIQTWM